MGAVCVVELMTVPVLLTGSWAGAGAAKKLAATTAAPTNNHFLMMQLLLKLTLWGYRTDGSGYSSAQNVPTWFSSFL
jgi:hypothetical protein